MTELQNFFGIAGDTLAMVLAVHFFLVEAAKDTLKIKGVWVRVASFILAGLISAYGVLTGKMMIADSPEAVTIAIFTILLFLTPAGIHGFLKKLNLTKGKE